MEKSSLVQVQEGDCNLLCNSCNLIVVENQFSLMQQVKKTALTDKFSNHVEVRLGLRVKTYAHVKHDIRVSQMIEHLNFLDKVLKSFPGHVPFAKFLDSYFGTHPAGFKDITVATSANKVSFCIYFELLEIDVKIETIFS